MCPGLDAAQPEQAGCLCVCGSAKICHVPGGQVVLYEHGRFHAGAQRFWLAIEFAQYVTKLPHGLRQIARRAARVNDLRGQLQ